MIDRYVIDCAETFNEVMLRAIEPKMTPSDKDNPKSEPVQATDKENVPKWTVTLSCKTISFGKSKFTDLPVTVTSLKQPEETLVGKLVSVSGLELGVMVQAKGSFSFFYSAKAIRPAQPVQSMHATRPASGQ